MGVAQTNRRVIAQFRAGGPVDGMVRDRLLLLTTSGRRSGRPHTTPMMFDRDGDDLVVIASNAGATTHPDWYRNLVHDQRVHVEIDDESYDAIASTITGADRDRVWAMLTDHHPFFLEHQSKAGRRIPLVRLDRGDRPGRVP